MNHYFKEKNTKTGETIGYKIFQMVPNFSFFENDLEELNEEEFYYEIAESEKRQKEEAERISIKNKILSKLPIEFSNHSTFTPYQVYQAYYYYYARWIWQLINLRGCSYQWLNINDYEFNRDEISCKSSIDWSVSTTYNSYLQMYENVKIELGKDIIKNGMYFPFIIATDTNSKILPIIFGKHRLYSLQLNPDETRDKEFLFIKFPHGFDFFMTHKSDPKADYQNNKIICTYLHPSCSNFVYEYKTEREELIFSEFANISDFLPEWIFKYRDLINSNPIFNNKEAFEEFINNPFNENKLQEIQKKWTI